MPETQTEKLPKHRRPKPPNERQMALARGILREGKTFKQSALDVGYSPNVAKQGLAFMRRDVHGIDKAMTAVAQEMIFKPDELHAMSVNRLALDIQRGKSSGLEKAIDTLGRFKIHDWFVRNADVQIGVFASLGESGPAIDTVAAVIPEPENE